jgi:hypothetical protein
LAAIEYAPTKRAIEQPAAAATAIVLAVQRLRAPISHSSALDLRTVMHSSRRFIAPESEISPTKISAGSSGDRRLASIGPRLRVGPAHTGHETLPKERR